MFEISTEKSALDVARDWADNEIYWMIKDAYEAAPKPKKDKKAGGKKKAAAPSTPKPLTIPPIPQVFQFLLLLYKLLAKFISVIFHRVI